MLSESRIDAWRLSRRQFLAGGVAVTVANLWLRRQRAPSPAPVALTLDINAPDPSVAAHWCNRLATHPGWRATICVDSVALAATARRMPGLWSDAVAQGHEIAYLAQPGAVDLDTHRADLASWQRQLAVSLATSPTVRFGRPADGVLRPAFLGLCAEAGLLAALWDEAWTASTPAILRFDQATTHAFSEVAQALNRAGRWPTTLWQFSRRTALPIPRLAVRASSLPATRPCRQHDFAWLDVPLAGSHSTMNV